MPLNLSVKNTGQDFPGVPGVRSLPVNAGDMGSIPGPGRFHSCGATKPVCHNQRAAPTCRN